MKALAIARYLLAQVEKAGTDVEVNVIVENPDFIEATHSRLTIDSIELTPIFLKGKKGQKKICDLYVTMERNEFTR